MPRRGLPVSGTFVLCLALSAAAPPCWAAGFSAFTPGIKAMGMGGAFTAQASDPSAGFYNPGGLALLEEGKMTVGAAGVYLNESQYQGLSPGPGAGTSAEQEQGMTVAAHAFTAHKLGERLRWGVGIYSPFALNTDWSDPDTFAGRRVTTDAELQTFDLNANLSWRVTPSFGLGAGVIYRTSDFTMGRRVASFNPNVGAVQDVASLAVETDFKAGIGWDAGFLHKIGRGFSWGASYRSPIEIDYTGSGKLTQIETGDEQFDALIAAAFPFDTELPASTTITFPDTATLGIAAGSERLLVAVDVTQTGWSNFEGLEIAFPQNGNLDQELQEAYEDSLSYRVGLQFSWSKRRSLRFGYAFEETPQPDSSLAPILPDAERSIVSVGFGRDWLDVGFQFISPSSRSTRTNFNAINGTYSGNTYILGISATKK